MKNFFNVLSFELNTYFKNKAYLLSTIIISLILVVGLSLPSFVDMSKLLSFFGESNTQVESVVSDDNNEKDKFVLVDINNVVGDLGVLESAFLNSDWTKVETVNEAEELVKSDDVKAGFVVEGLTKYSYLVNNSGFSDNNQKVFDGVLAVLNRENYASNKGLNAEELESLLNIKIESEISVLGKDGVSNYVYVYMLLFALYIMILLYGQLIAMSVTAEKSNRAMEILVTSVSSNMLIMGKVIGAALASFIQFAVVLGSGMIGYSLNSDSWNGILDNIFNIPSNILITFALFGGIGYLFYSFIFGALGALCSKTEDISASATPVTMIFVIVFFISMYGLRNSDSPMMVISSFIPFSSCMTMMIRVAMGVVSMGEVIISLVILIVSTVLVALGAAKIYRLGTLRYGNPIKLSSALKWLKKSE